MIFEIDDTYYKVPNVEKLKPILTCRQLYQEAYVIAYSSIHHGMWNRGTPKQYGILRPHVRACIRKLWIETDQACYEPNLPVSIFAIAQYALAIPDLPLVELYMTVRMCHCFMPNWDIQKGVNGEELVAQQLLGCLRVWPTLKKMSLGLNRQFLDGCTRPQLLVNEIEREITTPTASEELRKPGFVFNASWNEWVKQWAMIRPSSRTAAHLAGYGELEGRDVIIECVWCICCRLEEMEWENEEDDEDEIDQLEEGDDDEDEYDEYDEYEDDGKICEWEDATESDNSDGENSSSMMDESD
jgi:hypothetical protein